MNWNKYILLEIWLNHRKSKRYQYNLFFSKMTTASHWKSSNNLNWLFCENVRGWGFGLLFLLTSCCYKINSDLIFLKFLSYKSICLWTNSIDMHVTKQRSFMIGYLLIWRKGQTSWRIRSPKNNINIADLPFFRYYTII